VIKLEAVDVMMMTMRMILTRRKRRLDVGVEEVDVRLQHTIVMRKRKRIAGLEPSRRYLPVARRDATSWYRMMTILKRRKTTITTRPEMPNEMHCRSDAFVVSSIGLVAISRKKEPPPHMSTFLPCRGGISCLKPKSHVVRLILISYMSSLRL
jgi:hypothetical protein